MKKLPSLLKDIRLKKPLIHHMTNQVTMNFLANGILAAGGSPMMAHHYEEAAEAVMAADALILNIGTVEPDLVKGMILAGKKAKSSGIPVVLDPVGAGLSSLRKTAVSEIIDEVSPNVICGNAAEIAFLSGEQWSGKGVDGSLAEDSSELARFAANQLNCLVSITGKEDILSDGTETMVIRGGHEMLSYVTGTGCLSTSLIGLFLAKSVTTDLSSFERMAGALTYLGLCAERAVSAARGPGSFQTAFLDELYLLSAEELDETGRWETVYGGKSNEQS
ncbi:hydroxyethylthiazole kinase [Fictibacillus enclensis]|uniref:hydroxyethylthiazole kinase n=1 Tax=Fictibacillus enclensis TaxID=1017270 RepID=UPI00259FF4F8|nr:hydroxyethylthiazole kinase [Fictibacillus enclensis]MDM5198468.1 hydroxyethylthiazole kinase [Fictibacillus enclensis]